MRFRDPCVVGALSIVCWASALSADVPAGANLVPTSRFFKSLHVRRGDFYLVSPEIISGFGLPSSIYVSARTKQFELDKRYIIEYGAKEDLSDRIALSRQNIAVIKGRLSPSVDHTKYTISPMGLIDMVDLLRSINAACNLHVVNDSGNIIVPMFGDQISFQRFCVGAAIAAGLAGYRIYPEKQGLALRRVFDVKQGALVATPVSHREADAVDACETAFKHWRLSIEEANKVSANANRTDQPNYMPCLLQAVKGNTSDLSRLETVASAGDPVAQDELGIAYQWPNTPLHDLGKAVYWFKRAAEQGNADAENNLGSAYGAGAGTLKDYAKSLYWLRKSAKQGDAYAEFNIGLAYANGKGLPRDDRMAVDWYRKAAMLGLATAENNLASCYQDGRGAPKDYQKAFYWMHKAAEQGVVGDEVNLGKSYLSGLGVPKDYAKAARWFRMAAESGDAGGETGLGSLYLVGWGVPRDYHAAAWWLQRAAARGVAGAEGELGFLYMTGLGVPRNYAEAVAWSRKAAEQGDVDAERNLGVLYAYGLGVPRDYRQGVELLRKAAAVGDAMAVRDLAKLHTSGPSTISPIH